MGPAFPWCLYLKVKGENPREHVCACSEKYAIWLIIYLLHMSQLAVLHMKVWGRLGITKIALLPQHGNRKE